MAKGLGQHSDAIQQGVVFHVRYLGSTLVAELEEEGLSYGTKICAEAIKAVYSMVKKVLII